jgi:hypothetical protein
VLEVLKQIAEATGEIVEAIVPRLAGELHELARLRPSAVVFQSFGSIEQQLRATLTVAGIHVDRVDGIWALAGLAVREGLITGAIDDAIKGLAALHDMLAYEQTDVDTARALEFAGLSVAVLDTLEDEEKRLALGASEAEEKRPALEASATVKKRPALEASETEEKRLASGKDGDVGPAVDHTRHSGRTPKILLHPGQHAPHAVIESPRCQV